MSMPFCVWDGLSGEHYTVLIGTLTKSYSADLAVSVQAASNPRITSVTVIIP